MAIRRVEENHGYESLLLVREVALELRVTPAAVYRWIEEGRIVVVRAGRAIRIPRRSMEEFLQEGSAI